MRKIHEVLRLHFVHGRSKREIARIISVSPTTVSDYLARAKLAGLSFPHPRIAVAAVQGRADRRFPVQRLLRTLPRLRQQLSLSMRQTHTPGERLVIDYAGQTVGVIDGATGEIRPAQIFVAVLGASNYTYIEATWSQQLPDWIGSHVRGLDFFGGCTELWVPDNLRSGVSKSESRWRSSGTSA